MRKKIFALVFTILILCNTKIAYAIDLESSEVKLLENQLYIIGLKDGYSKNIVNYIKNLKISEEEIKDITTSGSEIKGLIGDNTTISDFNISELYAIYNKTSNLADKLDLGISFNFLNKSITVKDKNNSNILLKANTNDIDGYIENFKSPDSENNIELLASIFKEDIVGDAPKDLEKKNTSSYLTNYNESSDKYIGNDVNVNSEGTVAVIADKNVDNTNNTVNNNQEISNKVNITKNEKAKENNILNNIDIVDNNLNVEYQNVLFAVMAVSLLGAAGVFIKIISLKKYI